MKKLTIASSIGVIVVTLVFTWWTLCAGDSTILGIGSFIVLSLTLIVLIWYAFDTNSIAKVTRERWAREGVLSTTYSMELIDSKGQRGQTLFKITNPSTLVVRAKINCNFKIYGESVSAGHDFDGTDNWLVFPQQINIGSFELNQFSEKKRNRLPQ